MESADATERKWACVAVSNLIQNDPSTRRLLQGKNVVGALIKRLTDSEEEVVVEAVGALRCVQNFPQNCQCMLMGTIEIFVSMAVMKSVLKCITRISSPH